MAIEVSDTFNLDCRLPTVNLLVSLFLAAIKIKFRSEFAFACHMVISGGAVYGQHEIYEKEYWRDKWSARESEIVSARIEYRMFSNNEFKPLNSDSVVELFDRTSFSSDKRNLAEFVNSILTQPHPAKEPWTEKVFTTKGNKTKNVDPRRILVFDGTNRIVEEKNNKK